MRILSALLFALFLLPLPAAAQTAIGKVERVLGDVRGSFAGADTPVAAGAAVFLDETITTTAGARIALTFDDGTTLNFGENATLLIDAFVYQPAGASQFHADVVGAFRYVSGKLAAGATREATVTTPVATIGVRGTDFWGGPINGRYGIVVIEGAVSVTTLAGASVTLNQIGMGVDIDGGVAAQPIIWGEARRLRALAEVNID